MSGRVYLDWNATAPLRPEARAAMLSAMDVLGNPSSVHGEGRAARGVVERARAQVAALTGAKVDEVVFTSGATEGAAVLGRIGPGSAVCVQDTAHDCLWSHLDLGPAAGREREAGHVLAMGLANSETGIVTPVPEAVEGGWSYGQIFCSGLFLDVVQAAGRWPWSFAWSEAQMALLSAHKLGGPKGVGALLVKDGTEFTPALTGGGQELGRRAGTENVIGIAGFGAAAETALTALNAGVWNEVAKKRDRMEAAIAVAEKQTIFVGKDVPRLPNTSCFALPGWKGETQVMQMDLAGFAISAGSACSSGKVKESRVLRAMGHGAEVAGSAIRVSLGPETTDDEVDSFVAAWAAAAGRRRARVA